MCRQMSQDGRDLKPPSGVTWHFKQNTPLDDFDTHTKQICCRIMRSGMHSNLPWSPFLFPFGEAGHPSDQCRIT